MKRLYALLLAALAAAACIQDPDAPMNLPDIPVISVDETSVTRVSMLVNGVFGKDMTDISAYGVEVSETLFENGGTYQTLAPQEVTGGAFSLGVTGLKSNSTYFLRAFISNGHSKMYSSIITQQTPETSVASVSDVTARDGFLVASIEDNGGRSVEDVGFMWGTSSERKELKREKRYVGTLSEDGKTFTLPLSVVGYGTYYVMAYAEDDKDGTGYSRIPLNVEMRDPSQPNSEIWYTSVDGVVVNPTVKDGFGARIVSNTNEDGKGVIAFDGPVTRIPESAFRQSRLVTVTLPGSVEEVGRYAFDQNGAERTLEAFYGKGASQDHLSLVIGGTLVAVARMNEELDFVIPDGVTKVERGVFEQCHYRSITLPEGLKDTEYGFPSLYHLEAFYGPQTSEDHRCVIIDGELRAVAPEGLTSYVVTDPITGVGNYALYNGFSQIGRLILPESATYIGSQAFGQTQIDTLGLPAHLKEIRDEAFYAMYGLISLTVPEEVETIGSRAFGQAGKDYGGLYNLTFLPTVPPAIREDTFADLLGDGPFYVPAESVEAYKTARYWSAYADRIRGILVEDVTEAVDLGLSVKWASMNLGASSPEEFGDYYAWGETETKENYNWVTYTWCDGDYNKLTKYNTSSSYGTIDNKTVLDPEDDVAHVKLGEKWRLPTSSEIDELVSTRDNASYQWEWKSLNGHNGWLVTYLVNNNSIFLPAAGRHENTGLGRLGELGDYWSSSIKGEPCYAYHVDFDIGFVYTIHSGERYKGLSVRPVWGDRSDESVSASRYLTFSSEGSTAISLSPGGDVDLLLFISFDGQTWSQWDYSSLTFTASNPLYMCGKNPSGLDSSRFVTSGDNFSVAGNIMSLLDKDEDLLVVPVYGFMNLFINNTGLVSAPSMPATSLGSHSYTGMYQGCISLTSAPALPATEVAMFAYQKMFSGCTSLNDAPELPATTIHINSYDGMFNGCTSLKTVPALPATDLSDADFCYKGMFEGCSGLTDAPELPATSLGTGCYQNMFTGCTSLTIAPELSASSLIDSCYKSMFSGCGSLSYVKCLATDISAMDCVNNWLSNVAATGTFIKAPNSQWPSGSSGIPSGWTVEIDNSNPITASKYLTFNSEGTTKLSLNDYGAYPLLYYSTDAVNWMPWDYSQLSFSVEAPLYICGDNPTGLSHSANEFYETGGEGGYCQFSSTGDSFSVSGDIMSLINHDEDVLQIPCPGCFNGLFYNCKNLISGPELPATSLTEYCYSGLFYECRGLTLAPALPATSLAKGCYAKLFQYCSSLTTPPILPATELAEECYASIFSETGLLTAPELPSLTMMDSCYSGMFRGCRALVTPPVLPATSLANSCYSGMFGLCTTMTSAPELPATELATSCYSGMFYKCEQLSAAPVLPALVMAPKCYDSMFQLCGITVPPELPSTTLAKECYSGMFEDSKISTAPALPATTLAEGCYSYMFDETGLTIPPELPATTLAKDCYNSMFHRCYHLQQAPALPVTTLAENCYRDMFKACYVLQEAPELPATTLANFCYSGMFADCASLSYVKCLATDISGYNCLYSWLSGVASTGTFVKSAQMNDWPTGTSGIPEGWTVEDAQ